MAREQTHFEFIVNDWLCWNKTYHFMEDKNQQYIDVNLQNKTLAGINLDVLIFVNNSGEVVFAKSVNSSTAKEEPVPDELFSMIEDGSLLTKGDNDSISGFILLDKNPMFIECRPIVSTKFKGPSRGTLIFGRFLDEELLDSFRSVTRSSIIVYGVNEKMPPDFQMKIGSFSDNPDKIVIETLNDNQIAGYFGINDIKGQLALILRVDYPRDFYIRSEKAINHVYFTQLLTGLITALVAKFVFDKLVVSRLKEIDNFVTRVREEKKFSKKLSIESNDELDHLAGEINGLLNEISLSEQELKFKESEKKVLLDSLDEMIIFVSPEFKVLWANKAALEYAKMDLG
ncbi:MAG: CHASE4 domain-containing protein [Euryarchaeota archaeon]|nr:CHASE4 domain-containing protein [Euryarchaeota archaeon]